MGDVVRSPSFPGNDILVKCVCKSCDDELELFMPVNSGINLTGDVSQPMKNEEIERETIFFERSLFIQLS